MHQIHSVANKDTLNSLSETSRKVEPLNGRACPLCSIDLASKSDPYGHIAKHLERVAAFSLSSADIDDTEEVDDPRELDEASQVHICKICGKDESNGRKIWNCVDCSADLCDDCCKS